MCVTASTTQEDQVCLFPVQLGQEPSSPGAVSTCVVFSCHGLPNSDFEAFSACVPLRGWSSSREPAESLSESVGEDRHSESGPELWAQGGLGKQKENTGSYQAVPWHSELQSCGLSICAELN